MLLAVVLAANWFSLPATYHPLTLFRYYARQLAKKVHPDPNRPPQQQLISGNLAVIVATAPPLLLCYSLYQFSELPQLLDALLLYISLDWQQQRKHILSVSDSLKRGQLMLAKEQATKLVLRDTSRLTAMGISKAMLESTVLRNTKLMLGVCCWFLGGGGIAALAYRLLQELAQQWNSKLPLNTHFGVPAAWLATITAAPALLISSVILALQHGISRCYKQIRQIPRLNISSLSFLLLCCTSVAVRCNLGGPAYYGNTKLLRSRIPYQRDPAWQDIGNAVRVVHFVQLYFMLLALSVTLVQLALLWLK
ncbi:adenosylcobinamide-phosphate synthase [Rheinheimera pacifica]|uniref:cobalamin biosynthesis protein CobD/CbiB n=1 Tax=Rheinheimera pacifica TaxID=173990 RepID=UPI00285BA17A|nr:cobalamin biosynthesis protein [Rheinheimera pacifica]MDR6983391.1 adenosylcobinamide-phosphate synthase [Rheinheimera pacifica]